MISMKRAVSRPAPVPPPPRPRFVRPEGMVAVAPKSELELDRTVEYSLAAADLDWLARFNAGCPEAALSPDELELVIDRLEKDSFYHLNSRRETLVTAAAPERPAPRTISLWDGIQRVVPRSGFSGVPNDIGGRSNGTFVDDAIERGRNGGQGEKQPFPESTDDVGGSVECTAQDQRARVESGAVRADCNVSDLASARRPLTLRRSTTRVPGANPLVEAPCSGAISRGLCPQDLIASVDVPSIAERLIVPDVSVAAALGHWVRRRTRAKFRPLLRRFYKPSTKEKIVSDALTLKFRHHMAKDMRYAFERLRLLTDLTKKREDAKRELLLGKHAHFLGQVAEMDAGASLADVGCLKVVVRSAAEVAAAKASVARIAAEHLAAEIAGARVCV